MQQTDEYRVPPRARWRFSLREIMIGAVALCAILALVVKIGPLKPTLFFQSFNDERLLKQVCQRLRLQYSSDGRSAGRSRGSRVAKVDVDVSFRELPVEQSGRIVAGFRKAIQAELRRHRCQIRGHGYSGSLPQDELSSFHFDYRRGRTHGEIQVAKQEGANRQWRIQIFIREF